MYEYKVIPIYETYPMGWENQETREDYINRHAKEGWRLISVDKYYYYYERPINEKESVA
jgi:hypothetical protein